jgi:hypothetical protein
MDPMATHCRKLIVTGIYQANSQIYNGNWGDERIPCPLSVLWEANEVKNPVICTWTLSQPKRIWLTTMDQQQFWEYPDQKLHSLSAVSLLCRF